MMTVANFDTPTTTTIASALAATADSKLLSLFC